MNKIYEVEFEQLVEGEKTPIDSKSQIFAGLMDITISMGKCYGKNRKNN